MECPCGSTTRGAKADRSKIKATLHYQECPACGRCCMDMLTIDGRVVATGREAQVQFLALDAELEIAAAGKKATRKAAPPQPAPEPEPVQEPEPEPQAVPAQAQLQPVPAEGVPLTAEADPLQPEESSGPELDWQPTSQSPGQQDLVKVEFTRGGSFVAHASYFSQSWDLISRWALYDNAADLRRSFEPKPIPSELQIETPSTPPANAAPAAPTSPVDEDAPEKTSPREPVQADPPPARSEPPKPVPASSIPIGANLAFDF